MTKISNTQANEVVNVYTVMNELVKKGEIHGFEMKYNEETKTLDVKTTPVMPTEYIEVTFSLPNSKE